MSKRLLVSYHANSENEEREKERRKGGEEEEKNEGKNPASYTPKARQFLMPYFPYQ